jgi:iron complex transport system substrate-binding protein
MLLSTNPQAVIMLSGLPVQLSVEKAHLPVLVLERRNGEDIKRSTLLLGRLLGSREEEVAKRFCAYYDNNLQRVQSRTAKLTPQRRTRVYYVAAGTPLNTDGANTMSADWIQQAGGINVAAAAGIDGMNRTVSMEQIMLWNPEVIISSTHIAAATILSNPQWANVEAVRQHRVYVNPKALYLWARNSSETALQTLWAARTIHPELFGDIDMNRETRSFYRSFFHYQLNDAELHEILVPAY